MFNFFKKIVTLKFQLSVIMCSKSVEARIHGGQETANIYY